MAADPTTITPAPGRLPAAAPLPRARPQRLRAGLSLGAALAVAAGCGEGDRVDPPPERSLTVTATAYTSHPGQTDARPRLAAWGDTLRPGTRAIAVSPDLLGLGLARRTPVRIEGLRGRYRVLDRMDDRWRRRIDIYMGDDLRRARNWGERRVTIRWRPEPGAPAPGSKARGADSAGVAPPGAGAASAPGGRR